MAAFDGQLGTVNAQPGTLEPGVVIALVVALTPAAFHVNIADIVRYLCDVGDQPREMSSAGDHNTRVTDVGEHPLEGATASEHVLASVNVGAANG